MYSSSKNENLTKPKCCAEGIVLSWQANGRGSDPHRQCSAQCPGTQLLERGKAQ